MNKTTLVHNLCNAIGARMNAVLITGVDSITAPLSNIESDLQAHASRCTGRACELRIEAARLDAEADDLIAEANRATKIAKNIAKVLA